MKRRKIISLLLCLTLMLTLIQPQTTVDAKTNLTYSLDGLTIETAPDTDFTNQGLTKAIDFVNPDFANNTPVYPQTGCISLFTAGHTPFVSTGSIKTNTAVIVDSSMTVTKVINKAPSKGAKPAFNEATNVDVPEGGFVLLACDSSYANAGYKKFIAENFEVGDVVKLLLNGQVIRLSDVLALTGQNVISASLTLNYSDMYSTSDSTATISGIVKDMNPDCNYWINIQQFNSNNELIDTTSTLVQHAGTVTGPAVIVTGGAATVTGPALSLIGLVTEVLSDGTFSTSVTLTSGVNYFDVTIVEDTSLLYDTTQSEIIVKKDATSLNQPIVLWIDQFSNAKNLNSTDKIRTMVATAKKAGVTAFAFDVKGCEGYASYKKADLTNVPYMTETKTATKAVNMDIDFLEEMIKAAHEQGIELYASFNFFTEGNVANHDSAIDIFNNHQDWAEVFYAPEDQGELKSVLDTARTNTLIYVNPANPEVTEFELKRAEEVLKNYDIDGIVMDRTRYDNQYADFSDITKAQFITYLQGIGKTLNQWPQDVYTFDASNNIVPGPLYNDWITFRSGIIKNFVSQMSTLVNKYEGIKGKEIKLSAYVGAWYESLYQNGVNWAAPDFTYNKRLNLPNSSLYTSAYADTSYTDYIDFLMIGCYYPTGSQIARYTTLGNILTKNEIPFCGSIDITSITTPEQLRECFQSAYDTSDGAMIFDLIYVDWYKMQCAIQDIDYENPYLLAVRNPLTNEIITLDNINTARSNDTIILYTDSYGDTTGTNQWGVEVVVDATGHVTKVVNQTQAANWNWSPIELNNSEIPRGGFVLSGMDRSGSKVLRQLLANSFHTGDQTCAVSLTGYTDYTMTQYTSADQTLSFYASAYGCEAGCTVTVNDQPVACADPETSRYDLPVHLNNGSNVYTVKVYANDTLMLTKEIVMTGVNLPADVTDTPTPTGTVTPIPDTPTPTVTEPAATVTPSVTPASSGSDSNPAVAPTNTPAPTAVPEEEPTVSLPENVTTTTGFDADGNLVTQFTYDAPGQGTTATASLITDEDGHITSGEIQIGFSDSEATVNQTDSASMNVTLPEAFLIYLKQEWKKSEFKEAMSITMKLPEESLCAALTTEDVKKAELSITIPSKIDRSSAFDIANLPVSKNVLQTIADTKKPLTLKVTDETGKLMYSWTIKPDQLSTKIASDLNLAVNIGSTKSEEKLQSLIEKDQNNAVASLVEFNVGDEFSSKVTVSLSKLPIFKKGQSAYVYSYDPDSNVLSYAKKVKVNKNGCVSLNAEGNQTFVITKYKMDSVK